MKRLNELFTRKQNGDTIIEVLVSMTILALVLGATFVSTSHSLQLGTAATNRQQATAYAQQQVEYIKNIIADTSSSEYTQYASSSGSDNAGKAFQACPSDGGSTLETVTTSSNPSNNSNPCGSQFGQYTISDHFNNGLFTITATWPGPDSNSDQLTFYYRIPSPSTYAQTTLNFSSPCDGTAVEVNTQCNLTWSATNANSCTASSVPSDSSWSGSEPFTGSQYVTVTKSTTYKLSCDNGGSPVVRQVVINLQSATVDLGVNTATGSRSASINLGSSVTLAWQGNGTSSCPSSSPGNWANSHGNSGQTTVTPASVGSYDYYITCNIVGGGSIDSDHVTVTVTPAAANPKIDFLQWDGGPDYFGDEEGVGWHSNSTYYFYWGTENVVPNGCSLANIGNPEPANVPFDASKGNYGIADGDWQRGNLATTYGQTFTLNCNGAAGTTPVSLSCLVLSPTYPAYAPFGGGVGPLEPAYSPDGLNGEATEPACQSPGSGNTAPPAAPTQIYFCLGANQQQCNYGPFNTGFSCNGVGVTANSSSSPGCSSIPNDSISSYLSIDGTTTIASYWNANYGTPCMVFDSFTPYIGNTWNDQISAFKTGASC